MPSASAPGKLIVAGEYAVLEGAPAIGDSLRDLQAAAAAGATPILVRTGNGRRAEASLPPAFRDIPVFDDLEAAAAALTTR